MKPSQNSESGQTEMTAPFFNSKQILFTNLLNINTSRNTYYILAIFIEVSIYSADGNGIAHLPGVENEINTLSRSAVNSAMKTSII